MKFVGLRKVWFRGSFVFVSVFLNLSCWLVGMWKLMLNLGFVLMCVMLVCLSLIRCLVVSWVMVMLLIVRVLSLGLGLLIVIMGSLSFSRCCVFLLLSLIDMVMIVFICCCCRNVLNMW